MPRQVDHDARRRELAQAVWTLIREQGIAGVTIRNLSAKSGWSSGAIRHYLPSRDAILTFAAGHLHAEVEARASTLTLTDDHRQNFLDFLQMTLPIDGETRTWMEVWLAFVGAAVSDAQYANTHGVLYRGLQDVLCGILSDFHAQGWLPGHTPEAAALELHALLDGLAVHLLLRQIAPAQATAVLENAVDRLIVRPATESGGHPG